MKNNEETNKGKENTQKRLSIESKIDLINKHKKGVPVLHLSNEFGIQRQSVDYLLKNESAILERRQILNEIHGNKNTTRIFGVESTPLELCIYKWYIQKRSIGEPVTGQTLREKAIFFNERLGGSSNFLASTGWCSRFKHRHGISNLSVKGENLFQDLKRSAKFGPNFKKILEEEGIELEHVYNADEIGLAYKTFPKKISVAHSEKEVPDTNIDENRLTVLICANATGTHKIPLLLIDKYKNPQCLKNISRLPVHYHGQSNAWMNKEIFLDWYQNIFLPEVKEKNGEGVKYALLLDNAPSHPPLEELTAIDPNCKIIYLPPNATSLIQPMEQGIKLELKRLYKTDFLRALVLQKPDDKANIDNILKKWSLLDCIYSLAHCWDRVNENCLQNSWNLLLHNKTNTVEVVNSKIEEIVKLTNSIIKDVDFSSVEIVKWLKGDNLYPGFFYMNDEEILQHKGQDPIEETLNDEDPSEDVPPDIVPTNNEVYSACEVLSRWIYTKDKDRLVQLNMLNELKKTVPH